MRKAGNRVRITAQLIEGATDSHLWAERYDRDLNDIFALQDEISEAIVNALKLKLLPAEKKAIEQRSTSNPEAYKHYLMARQYNAMGNSRHRDISVRLCQRAVEIDPGYARAWALLAICQANTRMVNVATGDTGWAAAERALTLEPDLAEAHAAKGRILADAGRFDEAMVEHTTAAPRPRRLRGQRGGRPLPHRDAALRRSDRVPRESRGRDRSGFLGARHGDSVLRGDGRRQWRQIRRAARRSSESRK